MNRLLKCILSLICVFGLLVMASPCFAVSAVASETDDKVIVSEYEYITSIRAMSDSELEAAALSESEIQMIRSNVIEDEILARKQLSDAVLMEKYGYTYEDISILREYDGERLENNAELAAITGTLTISRPIVTIVTTTTIGVRVMWSWDHCPLMCATDVFAIYWEPSFGSQSGNMRIIIPNSSHTVTYNFYNTYFNRNWNITQVSPTSSAKSLFGMQDQTGEGWAEHGTLELYFEATAGSAALTEIDFIFAYGHTVLSASPSVSFPDGGGISFGFTTDEADTYSGYINVRTTKWYDN